MTGSNEVNLSESKVKITKIHLGFVFHFLFYLKPGCIYMFLCLPWFVSSVSFMWGLVDEGGLRG